jgi:preprotein translocase subunit YajC
MEINWLVLGVLAVVVIGLIVFLIRRNQKEKKKLEKFLNNDFKKPEEDEPDYEGSTER